MKRAWLIILIVFVCGCAIRKVETSKSLYDRARQAEAAGNDLEAVIHWKALLQQADMGIQSGRFLTTNYFLRASAYFEIGEWERGFEDLKNVRPELLAEEEFWIYPLYAVMMGDYYSRNNMTSVADNFYQAVLKKSAFKSSGVYLLALERHVNNSIKAIEFRAEKREDAQKYKLKEYEDLVKDVQKFVEESPSRSTPHFLLANLLAKAGRSDEALEHFLAGLEMGLPTQYLRRSTEFEMASLLSNHEPSSHLKSVLLDKAVRWWGQEQNSSIFRAGENNVQWILQQESAVPLPSEMDPNVRLRYLAVSSDGKLKILAWEKIL